MDVPRNLNAVQFELENAGEVTLVGRGAGGPETATAVVREIATKREVTIPVRF